VKRQHRTQVSGPLPGHVQQGRRYLSPLAATGVLIIGDWVRDDLPDLLWPVLTLAEAGSSGAVRFVRWQGAVQRDLEGRVDPRVLADGLDGRLTSLDRLVAQVPEAVEVVRQRATQFALLSPSVARALALYPERPASWLVDLDLTPPGQSEVELLARAVSDVVRDGHREAIMKCFSIWSAVHAGTFRSDATTIELLKPYPNDSSTRSQADTAIRASWGAQRGLRLQEDPHYFDASIKWAKVFWGMNSMTTRCIRHQDVDRREDGGPVSTESAAPASTPEGGTHLRQLAMDLLSSYIEALETSPARLYDQECQEVHSGLVTRAGREVITALGARDLWCMEHGAHVGRVLVEVRIYLQWMAQQDPTVYQAFQEYGAGKAKLYARIADEIPKDWLRPSVSEAIGELERLSHNDDVLDHRVVDTSDSFAGGKSLRAMAKECGLLDLYRQAYYMSSGVTHSEWWSVETHCMERCMNILHRGHLIPSLSLSAGGNVELANSWVDSLYTLIRLSLNILRTSEEAVNEAFSWLNAAEPATDTEDADASNSNSGRPAGAGPDGAQGD
jgi:hypothetical protein